MKFKETVKRQQNTKSFRLELIPTAKTLETIKSKGLMELNQQFEEMAEQVKPAYDEWIKAMLNNALCNCSYDFSNLEKIETAIKNDEIEKSKKDDELKKIKNVIVSDIKNTIKNNCLFDIEKLPSAKFLQEILPKWLSNQKKEDMPFYIDEMLVNIEKARDLSSYLKKFSITRITAIMTTAVDRVLENYEIYRKNISAIKIMLESDYNKEIIKNYPMIQDCIYISNYNSVLSAEGIAYYNSMISGKISEKGVEIKGFNMLAQEITQSHNDIKLQKIKKLNKQILFPVEKMFTINTITNDDEARDILNECMVSFNSYAKLRKTFVNHFDGAVVLGTDLGKLSHICTGKYNLIPNTIVNIKRNEYLSELNNTTDKRTIKKINKKLEDVNKEVSKEQYTINEILDIVNSKEFIDNINNFNDTENINNINDVNSIDINKIILNELDNSWGEIEYTLNDVKNVINNHFYGNSKTKIAIVNYFDAITKLHNIVKLFKRAADSEKANTKFYMEITDNSEFLILINKGLNLLRNYLTKTTKNMAINHITCFGNIAMVNDTWFDHTSKDGLKVATNSKLLLKNEANEYFIAFRTPDSPKFELINADKDAEVYKLYSRSAVKAQKSFMIIPKVLFCKAVKNAFIDSACKEVVIDDLTNKPMTCSREIYNIYSNGLYKDKAVKANLVTEGDRRANEIKLIDYFIKFFKNSKVFSKYTIEFDKPENYATINDLWQYIDAVAVSNEWLDIDAEQINALVECGCLLMFKLNARYLYSEKHKGYSKVFLDIFSDENIKNPSLYINSRADISYRPAVIDNPIVHKKGNFLVNKTDKNGEMIPPSIYTEIYKYYNGMLNKMQLTAEAKEYIIKELVSYRKATYDIIKDKRYSENKFFITMSYKTNSSLIKETSNILTEECLTEAENGNRLAVIRNAEHLAYCRIVDKNNNILFEKDLDTINGINYKTKLSVLSNERKNNKSDKWEYDSTVKNIRTAYIDFAITEIVNLALKYNAIIVIEKPNNKFKDKMSMIDDQIYKLFETRLESRLQCITSCSKEGTEPGSNMNPIQLAKSDSYSSTLCNGILVKTIPTKITVMDPKNGFVNLFDFKKINKIAEKNQFISKFKSIKYDSNYEGYICEFDYNDFITTEITNKTKWTLLAAGKRSKYDKNAGHNIIINNIANIMHEWAISNNISDDTDLAKMAFNNELSNEGIKNLFNLIVTTLKNLNYKEKDNDTLFVSPVIDGSRYEYTKCQVAISNLLKKNSLFLKTRNEKFDKNKNYTKEWLDYAMDQ